MPAVDEIVMMCPERCLRMTGSTTRVTFSGPPRFVASCWSNCSGDSSSKKPAKKVPRVVDQYVDPAETFERGPHSRLGRRGTRDVELDDEQVVSLAHSGADRAWAAAGRDHRTPGVERGPRDVDAHASAGTGHKPHVLVSHLPPVLSAY